MGEREQPVFFENRFDNKHCLHAAMKMVLAAYNIDISWEELDQETGFEQGRNTRLSTGAYTLSRRIPGVGYIARLDEREYVYSSSEQVVLSPQHDARIIHPRREVAVPYARALIEEGLFDHRELQKEDLIGILEKNFFIASVDAGKLSGSWGSHAVLLYASDETSYFFHDPGYPPAIGRKIAHDDFMYAFGIGGIVVPKPER